MLYDNVSLLALFLGYATFVITQNVDHDGYNKQLLLHDLNFQIQQMHEELYGACPDIFKHRDFITTGILGRRNTPGVMLDLEIRLAQKTLSDLKSKYALCTGRSIQEVTNATMPSTTRTSTPRTESSTSSTTASTAATSTVSPARHAFQVLQSKSTIYKNYFFLALQLKLPDNGLSKSENWCRDYEYLCEDLHHRPTGCGLRWFNWTGYNNGVRKCGDVYNSDMDIGNVLDCNPSADIANIANSAFPNLPKRALGDRNAFGFHVCGADYCQKTIQGSNLSLYQVSDFWASGDTTVYTVCH